LLIQAVSERCGKTASQTGVDPPVSTVLSPAAIWKANH
jgi:hypothetical protein